MVLRRFVLALSAIGLLALSQGFAAAQSREIVVFAAASMKTAIDEIGALWAKSTGEPHPRVSYAGSNTLAKQIEQGAPADIFLSADMDWMEYLTTRGLIVTDSRINLLGNRLAIVAPKDGTSEISLDNPATFRKALADGKLAMAHVEAVPAGKYGKAALEKLGLWEGVKGHVVQSDNVRSALVYVARGEAPLGIVYTTDAVAEPNVRVVVIFPEETHPPIIYPAARTTGSTNPAVTRFLAFLRSPLATQIFIRHGFLTMAAGLKPVG